MWEEESEVMLISYIQCILPLDHVYKLDTLNVTVEISLFSYLASLFCSRREIPLIKRSVDAVNTGDRTPTHWAPEAIEVDTIHIPNQRLISPK